MSLKWLNVDSFLEASGIEPNDWWSAFSFLTPLGNGLSWALVRLGERYEGSECLAVSSVNGREKFRAASVIKVAILTYLLYEAERGVVSLHDEIKVMPRRCVEGGTLSELSEEKDFSWLELAKLMIIVSDNSASNLIVELLGKECLNRFFKEVLSLRETSISRYFMHSPELAGENFTSACDCANLLASLWQGQILSSESLELFWSILSKQMFIEKLPARLVGVTKTYNKTGELDDGARHDIAVIEGQECNLALVFLSEQKDLAPWQVDYLAGEWAECMYKLFCVNGR